MTRISRNSEILDAPPPTAPEAERTARRCSLGNVPPDATIPARTFTAEPMQQSGLR